MGKGAARKSEEIQTKVADQSLQFAKELKTETDPYRKAAADFSTSILGGDRPTMEKAIGPALQVQRGAYKGAQEQIERTVGKGGARDRMIGNLAFQEAGSKAQIASQAVNDAVNRLTSLGTFGPQAATANFGTASSAGGHLGQLAAGKAQAVGQGISGISSGAGKALGMKMGSNTTITR